MVCCVIFIVVILGYVALGTVGESSRKTNTPSTVSGSLTVINLTCCEKIVHVLPCGFLLLTVSQRVGCWGVVIGLWLCLPFPCLFSGILKYFFTGKSCPFILFHSNDFNDFLSLDIVGSRFCFGGIILGEELKKNCGFTTNTTFDTSILFFSPASTDDFFSHRGKKNKVYCFLAFLQPSGLKFPTSRFAPLSVTESALRA